ncbi:hypothetical protein MKS88_005307 [Plasmodium brasilianum]|uniref:Uncharacterized protein n=1 Tax=Plasmodium brasilianum TaxID=5824 RepID=A0ACB9Y1T7_PLABR|nr:hypothetical protein MKS88_005307 [Plasmodium brasilianum]
MKVPPVNDFLTQKGNMGIDNNSCSSKKKNSKIISYLKNESKFYFLFSSTKGIKRMQYLKNNDVCNKSNFHNNRKEINNIYKNSTNSTLPTMTNAKVYVKNDSVYNIPRISTSEGNSLPLESPPGKKKRKEKPTLLNKMIRYNNVKEEYEHSENCSSKYKKYYSIIIKKKVMFPSEHNLTDMKYNYHNNYNDMKYNSFIKGYKSEESSGVNTPNNKNNLLPKVDNNFINNNITVKRTMCDVKNTNFSCDNLLQIYEHRYLQTISKSSRRVTTARSFQQTNNSQRVLCERLPSLNNSTKVSPTNYIKRNSHSNHSSNSKQSNCSTDSKHSSHSYYAKEKIEANQKEEHDLNLYINNSEMTNNNPNYKQINKSYSMQHKTKTTVKHDLSREHINEKGVIEKAGNYVGNMDDVNISKIHKTSTYDMETCLSNHSYNIQVNESSIQHPIFNDKKKSNDTEKIIKNVDNACSYGSNNLPPMHKEGKEQKVVNYYINNCNVHNDLMRLIGKEIKLSNYKEYEYYLNELKNHKEISKKITKFIPYHNVRSKKNQIKKKKIYSDRLRKKKHTQEVTQASNLEKIKKRSKKKEVIKKGDRQKYLQNIIYGENAGEKKNCKDERSKCSEHTNDVLISELRNEVYGNAHQLKDDKLVCEGNNEQTNICKNLKLENNINMSKEENNSTTDSADSLSLKKSSTHEYKNGNLIGRKNGSSNSSSNSSTSSSSSRSSRICIEIDMKMTDKGDYKNGNNSKNVTINKKDILKQDNKKLLLKNSGLHETFAKKDSTNNSKLRKEDRKHTSIVNNDLYNNCGIHNTIKNNSYGLKEVRENISRGHNTQITIHKAVNSNSKKYFFIKIENKEQNEKQHKLKNKSYPLKEYKSKATKLENAKICSENEKKCRDRNISGDTNDVTQVKKKKNSFHNNSNNYCREEKICSRSNPIKTQGTNEDNVFFPIFIVRKSRIYIEGNINAYMYLANNINCIICNIFKYQKRILLVHTFLYSLNLFVFYNLLDSDTLYEQANTNTKGVICILYFLIIELYILFLNNVFYFFIKCKLRKAVFALDKVNLIHTLSKLFPQYSSLLKKHLFSTDRSVNYSFYKNLDYKNRSHEEKDKKSQNLRYFKNTNFVLKNEGSVHFAHDEICNKWENNIYQKTNNLDKLIRNNTPSVYYIRDCKNMNEMDEANKKLRQLIRAPKDTSSRFNISKNYNDSYKYISDKNICNNARFMDDTPREKHTVVSVREQNVKKDKIKYTILKTFVDVKNKKKFCNFFKYEISTKIEDKIEQKPQLKLYHIDSDNHTLKRIEKGIKTKNSYSIYIYNLFNSSIYVLTNHTNEEENSKKMLYFKWKARKSYKKRVLNLPSTKSRRRYAQKNRIALHKFWMCICCYTLAPT